MILWPCFVCSEVHWDNSRLVGAALDPTKYCGHREAELVTHVQAMEWQRSDRERWDYLRELEAARKQIQ